MPDLLLEETTVHWLNKLCDAMHPYSKLNIHDDPMHRVVTGPDLGSSTQIIAWFGPG